MAEKKEIRFETLFTRAPGSDKLRKTAEARLRFLLRDGWHEMARESAGPDSVRVRLQREGHTSPLPPLRRVPEPPPKRRSDRGGFRGGPGR